MACSSFVPSWPLSSSSCPSCFFLPPFSGSRSMSLPLRDKKRRKSWFPPSWLSQPTRRFVIFPCPSHFRKFQTDLQSFAIGCALSACVAMNSSLREFKRFAQNPSRIAVPSLYASSHSLWYTSISTYHIFLHKDLELQTSHDRSYLCVIVASFATRQGNTKLKHCQ